MSISKVGQYAFYNHPNLEKATVSAPVIEAYAFQSSEKLNTVDLTSDAAVTINENAFKDCSNLIHLVVRSSTLSALSATSALDGTKFKLGDGGIYVPEDLLDSYKSATNWNVFAKNIYPIGEYPRTNFDTIGDSWATIFANSSYATAYAVKDTKTMELTDGTKIKMDLAAFDTDDKSDNSGKAKITWISHCALPSVSFGSVSSNEYGWNDSKLRTYLIDNILQKIPNEIKSHIVSVNKSYKQCDSTTSALTEYTIDDMIWAPSIKEVNISDDKSEVDGVVYSSYFSNNASRIKLSLETLSANGWWLRSVGTGKTFGIVSNYGERRWLTTNNRSGIVFGFCTD